LFYFHASLLTSDAIMIFFAYTRQKIEEMNMNKLIEKRKQIDGKVECYSIRELLSMIRDRDIVLAKSEMPMLFTTNMNAYRKIG